MSLGTWRMTTVRRGGGEDHRTFWDRAYSGVWRRMLGRQDEKKVADNEQGRMTDAYHKIQGEGGMACIDGEEREMEPGSSKVDSKVGRLESQATFWARPSCDGRPAIGKCLNLHSPTNRCLRSKLAIVFLDPTIPEGFPLWRWYRRWDSPPSCPSDLET